LRGASRGAGSAGTVAEGLGMGAAGVGAAAPVVALLVHPTAKSSSKIVPAQIGFPRIVVAPGVGTSLSG
jgi:hypothetical protein